MGQPAYWWIKLFHLCHERHYEPIGDRTMEIYARLDLPEPGGILKQSNVVTETFRIIRDEYETIWMDKLQRAK